MKEKIFNNWGLKLLSCMLAFVIWFVVVQVVDPQETRSFGNIKVKLVNTELLEAEGKVYEILEDTDTVRVTVRAPKSVFENFRASDIIAEADISKLTDINTIRITYDVQNADLGSLEISGNHDVVKLYVEEKLSKYVSIAVNKTGEPSEGYIVGNTSIDQNMIEISGPRSAVEKVFKAGVDIDVTGVSSSLSANMEIKLYDKEGEIVNHENENIKLQTEYARTNVEILATKEIPVEASYTGEPASGFLATGVVVAEPAYIRIAGSSSALSGINAITINAEKVDISGAAENVTTQIKVSDYLSGNVRLADSDFDGKINVTVEIEPTAQKSYDVPVGNLNFSNVPEGFTAIFQDDYETYQLKLSGLGSVLDSLNADEISGTVDLKSWMKEQNISQLVVGSYYMPVTFALPGKVRVTEKVLIHVLIHKIEE